MEVDAAEELIVLPGQTEHRTPVFCVLVKRTYAIRHNAPLERCVPANPLLKVDCYYDDDPLTYTVKHEAELVPYKIATDVALIGQAVAPRQQPVYMMDVWLEIAGRRKTIRVIGDRRCAYRAGRDPVFTDPEEFMQLPVRYERAYGGKDLTSVPGLPLFYPRNFMGTGVAVKNIAETVNGLALPNLEDPTDLLTPERIILGELEHWNRMPLPQGFGWLSPLWYPRSSYVGSVPGFVEPGEVMREELLGLVPKNHIALARQFRLPGFDIRYNNGASLGLAFPYLNGSETVTIGNMTSDGLLQFDLPGETPQIMLDIGLGENVLPAILQTVSIRLEQMQVDLIWRGAHEYPGMDWLPEMKKLHTEIQ